MVLRPRRALPALLVVLCILAACDRNAAAPPAPAPVPEPASVQGAANDPAAPSVVLRYSVDEPQIGTEVGRRQLGSGIVTTGKGGWLLFGPYAPLPAGRYQVELQGHADPDHAGVLHVDVARDKGATVVAAIELEPAAIAQPVSPDGWIVLPFTLTEPVSDLEVRVRVTEAARVAVAGYTLRALP